MNSPKAGTFVSPSGRDGRLHPAKGLHRRNAFTWSVSSGLWPPTQHPASLGGHFYTLHLDKTNLTDVKVAFHPWDRMSFFYLVANLSSFDSTRRDTFVKLSNRNGHPHTHTRMGLWCLISSDLFIFQGEKNGSPGKETVPVFFFFVFFF